MDNNCIYFLVIMSKLISSIYVKFYRLEVNINSLTPQNKNR